MNVKRLTMKSLMLISVILLVGCVTTPKTLEEKVVGTYEMKEGEDTRRAVFLDNGVVEDYGYGKKVSEAEWKISEEGEIHVELEDGYISVSRINPDGSITGIAYMDGDGGGREDFPKEDQETLKKTK